MKLVIAAFWTEDDGTTVLDEVTPVIQGVAVKGTGGVAVMDGPPDIHMRRFLRSIEGLEDAADA